MQHQRQGQKHVCLKFPEKTALTGFTEELYCGCHDENEAVRADVNVCEKYAVSFGCLPLCQRFQKFPSEVKWKGPFRFLLTGIFEITSGGGRLISVEIFLRKFAVLFLSNRFILPGAVHCPTSLHLCREFGKGIKDGKSHS